MFTCDGEIRMDHSDPCVRKEWLTIIGPHGRVWCLVPIQGDETRARERVDFMLRKLNGP